MFIKTVGNELVVSDNMVSIDDYKLMKEKITALMEKGEKEIVVRTPNPFAITSSLVGFFTKIVFRDKIKLTIYISDPDLYNLMEDLNLIETFNIQKDF